jgi:hypothetical protein
MAMPPNLHGLRIDGMYPLGVECRGCGRKALVPANRFGGCKGDMTELRKLRFVCQSCGSRECETKVFLSAGKAEAWLEGLIVSRVDGGRPTFRLPAMSASLRASVRPGGSGRRTRNGQCVHRWCRAVGGFLSRVQDSLHYREAG